MNHLSIVPTFPIVEEILTRECKNLGFMPRRTQIETCYEIERFINDKKKKFMSLLAPCGSGKSIIAKSIADYVYETYGKISAIITISNQLIDQYNKEFEDVNIFRGKSHYACDIGEGWTCEMGSEIKKENKLGKCQNCPFQIAKNNCYIEKYSFYNPMSWLLLPRYIPNNSKCLLPIKLMIIDEAHEFGSFLAMLSELILWEKDIEWISGITSSISGVINLLEDYENNLKEYCLRLIRDNENNMKENIKEVLFIKRKITLVSFLINSLERNPDDFVVEETVDDWYKTQMKCLKIRTICPPQKLLNKFFKDVDKVIFMSGTIFPIHMREIIHEEDYYKYEVESSIPIENRRILVYPQIDCSYKNKENYPKQISDKIFEVIENHRDQRGLISVSYADLERLKPYLDNEKRFIFNSKNTKKDNLKEFLTQKKKNDNRIAVFAASSVGLDLKNDLCRFIIIPKVKVASWNDVLVQMKTRKFRADLWYELTGMIDIIQASARGCRHENDFCTIYILDSNFNKYYAQTKHLLPKYFVDSVRIIK